jgi:TP901 family phage tail tape measure protein
MASRRIEVEIIGSSKSLQAAIGRSSASLTGFQRSADRLGRGLTTTGRTLTRNVTLPIVAVGAASVKMALDYDTAINHVQALTGASQKQTKQWSDQILALAPKIGQSPQDLANALYFVASSGAKVNQVLPITAASARAAASGMGDAQTIAQLLTSAMNAYGSKTLSASKATDILTEAVKVGKAEPGELAQEIGKVIPVAQSMGVTFAEATTSVSELTNTGLDAAQAATGVRAILTGLLKPASQTTKEFKDLGTSVGDVRKEIREKGLNAALQDLSKRVGGNQAAIGKLFPNVRALTAFLALTGKNAGNVSKALDQVEHSTGAANKAFAVAQHGPAFKLNQDLAQLRVTAIKLGNDLIPAFTRVAGSVGDVADAFAGLSPAAQTAILEIAGGAALLGPVLTVLGNVARVAGGASAAFDALSAAAGGEGLVAAAAVVAPELAALAITVGIVGVAMTQAGGDTDVLAGAFGRAQGAVTGLQGSLNHLKGAQDGVREATILNTSAQLAVKQAQQNVNRIVQQGGKGSLNYKIALNQLAQAQENARRTSAGLALAHQKLDKQEKATHRETVAAKTAYDKLSGSVQKHIKAVEQDNVRQLRGKGILKNFGDAANTVGTVIHNASGKFLALASSQQHAADVATQHNNPALANTFKQAARASRATGELIAQLGRMPTHKEVRIDIITNRYTGATSGPPTGGTPGDPHGGTTGHPAIGGPVIAGHRYMVGERGPEMFVPQSSGRIIPNGRSGGDFTIRIIDWEKGLAQVRGIAREEINGSTRRRGQLQRMGA